MFNALSLIISHTRLRSNTHPQLPLLLSSLQLQSLDRILEAFLLSLHLLQSKHLLFLAFSAFASPVFCTAQGRRSSRLFAARGQPPFKQLTSSNECLLTSF